MIHLALAFTALLAADSSQVVAVLNGKAITTADLEKRAAPSLLPLRQQEYQVKANAIRDIAYENLRAAEAARRGISVEELEHREIDGKVPEPKDEDIQAMLKALAGRLPQDAAQARAQAIDILRSQAREERENAFRKELFARANFEIRLTPPRARLPVAVTDPIRGKSDAPVTIVEFSDFQCPYCNRAQGTLRDVEKMYDPKVRLVFKQFPLDIHENARLAAEASVCANDQRKFWQLHDWMFSNVDKLTRDDILAAAKELGIQPEPFARCIDEHLDAKEVDADMALGEEVGVSGTPTFFVNGRLVEGSSADHFSEVIDEELRQGGGRAKK